MVQAEGRGRVHRGAQGREGGWIPDFGSPKGSRPHRVDGRCSRLQEDGIGEAMARKSIDRLAGRVKQVYLEVRPSNEAAILLYHKLSFEETGKVRKKYYPDGEDAIEMQRAV